MSGTSVSRTDRVRVLVVDDEPTLTEAPPAATEAGRRLHPAAVDRSALRPARDAVEHRIDGLRSGADHSVRVLGDLVPTRETREVHRAGRPIRLTARECDLPVIHSVRGTGYSIRSAEDGR
ncbi:hypothetical protein AB0N07_07210 [Streptomyces sp. NPDC051172]|uniref:hypothetical protein n=1 Tax=Streptomyces sp. NPDC051172 TaxID=3155796 RepID=UPI003418AB35